MPSTSEGWCTARRSAARGSGCPSRARPEAARAPGRPRVLQAGDCTGHRLSSSGSGLYQWSETRPWAQGRLGPKGCSLLGVRRSSGQRLRAQRGMAELVGRRGRAANLPGLPGGAPAATWKGAAGQRERHRIGLRAWSTSTRPGSTDGAGSTNCAWSTDRAWSTDCAWLQRRPTRHRPRPSTECANLGFSAFGRRRAPATPWKVLTEEDEVSESAPATGREPQSPCR